MNTKHIDLLNIFLIFISLFLAFKVPFELFLFSYAVLGPLHYLTEINWLREKKYFVKEKKWILILIIFTALISFPIIISLPILHTFKETFIPKNSSKSFSFLTKICLLSSFLFAIGLVHFKKWKPILLFFFTSLFLSIIILKLVPLSLVIIGVFLPTIIHVYLFTLLFMVFGTLNSKTNIGIVAIVFLILSPVIIIFSTIDPTRYLISNTTQTAFTESGIRSVNSNLATLFGQLENEQFHLLSTAGIKTQIFIAFAYTYHYLNWFSKTSIIGWAKNISKSKLIVIIAIWFFSVFLYFYNYRTGLIALFFLSFLHVLLEFPLNIVSIKGIYLKLFPKT